MRPSVLRCARSEGHRHRHRIPRRHARHLHGDHGLRGARRRRRPEQDRQLLRRLGPVLRARPAREACTRPSPPADCASPPTSTRWRSSATSTSSASAPRRPPGRTPPTCATSRRPSTTLAARICPHGPARRQVHRPGRHGGPAGATVGEHLADRRRSSSSPGTPSSCARASPSRTPCTPTASSSGWSPTRAEAPARARSTPRSLGTGTPLIVTDFATAELVKVAANAFLATKISFINAMAEVCEATGADVSQLAQALEPRRPHRPAVPQARPRIRRRLPAQGHPGLPAPRRGAGRRPGRQRSCARSTRSTSAGASARWT